MINSKKAKGAVKMYVLLDFYENSCFFYKKYHDPV